MITTTTTTMATTEMEFGGAAADDGGEQQTKQQQQDIFDEETSSTTSSSSTAEAEEEDSGFNSSEEGGDEEEEDEEEESEKVVSSKKMRRLKRLKETQNLHQHLPQTPPKRLEADASASVTEPPLSLRLTVYLSYGVLILFGYIRIFLERCGIISQGMCKESNREGYVPIYKSWQPFFTEYIYRRVSDIFGRPITGNPGGVVRVLERSSPDYNRSFTLTGRSYDCINLASYDYLGFSRATDAPSIERTIRELGVGVAPMAEFGRNAKHDELEQLLAAYLGKEACIVFGMGYATNAANIPALVTDSAETLILGDQHSHASVRAGLFLSKATFKFFKHNDFTDLEAKIRQAILSGNARTGGRPWRKIVIIVEGVYSMEGTIVDLPRLVELKRRYRCYLYIDEAHSIGAVGPQGRGVCDYFGVPPAEVDLLMGTMTKSFAAAGGYIAGSAAQIAHIRANSASSYAGAMAAPVAQQIINTLHIMMHCHRAEEEGGNDEGKRRIEQLLANTHYMREQLKAAGFIITGHRDSPVIPIMVYFPSKVGSIARNSIYKGLAVVAAGYPATTLPTCRIRLCMSASHSRATLDRAIAILSEMGDAHHIKYAQY